MAYVKHPENKENKNTMKKIRLNLSILIPLALFLMPACKTTYDPGSEPFVVEAERTVAVSFHVVDAFLSWEYANHTNMPVAITQAADKLRVTYPWAHETAVAALRTYKATRTEDERQNLAHWLAPIAEAIRVALLHLPQEQAQVAYAEAEMEITEARGIK